MLMKVAVPAASGNRAALDGSLRKVMADAIERIQPESALFGVENGRRTAVFTFDLEDATELPAICEPIVLALDAAIEIGPAEDSQPEDNHPEETAIEP